MEEVYSWVEQYGGNICRQLRRMGSSVDWSRQVGHGPPLSCSVCRNGMEKACAGGCTRAMSRAVRHAWLIGLLLGGTRQVLQRSKSHAALHHLAHSSSGNCPLSAQSKLTCCGVAGVHDGPSAQCCCQGSVPAAAQGWPHLPRQPAGQLGLHPEDRRLRHRGAAACHSAGACKSVTNRPPCKRVPNLCNVVVPARRQDKVWLRTDGSRDGVLFLDQDVAYLS